VRDKCEILILRSFSLMEGIELVMIIMRKVRISRHERIRFSRGNTETRVSFWNRNTVERRDGSFNTRQFSAVS
jgi:hypothetical protein